MKRLHPPSLCELWRDKQARLLEFGEDVKKKLCFLSEVALRAVKRRLASSFAIFLAKKMAERAGFEPANGLPR